MVGLESFNSGEMMRKRFKLRLRLVRSIASTMYPTVSSFPWKLIDGVKISIPRDDSSVRPRMEIPCPIGWVDRMRLPPPKRFLEIWDLDATTVPAEGVGIVPCLESARIQSTNAKRESDWKRGNVDVCKKCVKSNARRQICSTGLWLSSTVVRPSPGIHLRYYHY